MQHSGRKMHYNDSNLLRKFSFKTDICHFGYPHKQLRCHLCVMSLQTIGKYSI